MANKGISAAAFMAGYSNPIGYSGKALEGQQVADRNAPGGGTLRPRELLVSWDGEEVRTVCLNTFLADNADDAFVCGAVGALKPGESVSLGGGAAPMLVVVAL